MDWTLLAAVVAAVAAVGAVRLSARQLRVAEQTREDATAARLREQFQAIARLLTEIQQAAVDDMNERASGPGQPPHSNFPRKRAELEIALSTLADFGGPELPRSAELASQRELFPSMSAVLSLVQDGLREVAQASANLTTAKARSR